MSVLETFSKGPLLSAVVCAHGASGPPSLIFHPSLLLGRPTLCPKDEGIKVLQREEYTVS